VPLGTAEKPVSLVAPVLGLCHKPVPFSIVPIDFSLPLATL